MKFYLNPNDDLLYTEEEAKKLAEESIDTEALWEEILYNHSPNEILDALSSSFVNQLYDEAIQTRLETLFTTSYSITDGDMCFKSEYTGTKPKAD